MRLRPVKQPRGLLLKVAYYLSKRKFGKVISALSCIYARSTPVMKASFKIIKTEKKLSLPKELKLLIRYYTSHLNECPFCSNAIDYAIEKENIEFQHWKEFMNFRESQLFSDKEKALLAYLEEVNFSKSSTDETFRVLKNYFTEEEIVEITWINATENYFNLMAKPLGLSSDHLKLPQNEEKRSEPVVSSHR